MTHRVCRTQEDVDRLCLLLHERKRPFTASVVAGADRSKAQNRLAFKWYGEVGQQMGESVDEVHARAKLDIGCAILCRDDADFLAFCKRSMGHMGREDRLQAMKWIPVTSLMTTRQMTEFLETFERVHRAQGLDLTIPQEGEI